MAAAGAKAAVDALLAAGLQVLALKPNSDSGSVSIIEVLEQFANQKKVALVTHMPRSNYLSAMRHAAVLVGNSSSGIIEAASFGTPVINIGSRQSLRERNANVIDVTTDPASVALGIAQALEKAHFPEENIYGDGATAPRIVAALRQLDLKDPSIMDKANAY
jgi:GDP/UDP-N,N'-diacetylbacillosamine 2-epimerase (hydrolysing)